MRLKEWKLERTRKVAETELNSRYQGRSDSIFGYPNTLASPFWVGGGGFGWDLTR